MSKVANYTYDVGETEKIFVEFGIYTQQLNMVFAVFN